MNDKTLKQNYVIENKMTDNNKNNSQTLNLNNLSNFQLINNKNLKNYFFNHNLNDKNRLVKKHKNFIKKYINENLSSDFYNGIIIFSFLLIKFLLTIFIILNENENIVKILETIFFILSELFCLISIFSSPGILPSNIYNKVNKRKSYKNTNFPYKFRQRFYVLKGRLYTIKSCHTCLIIRPLGSSHCGKCNSCIEKIDHHCPWLGNCIGINNYKYFYLFLIFMIIYMSFSEFNIIYNIIYNFPKSKAKKALLIIFLIFCFFILSFVITLIITHTNYIMKGETTYLRIKLKGILILYGNPFDKGIKLNLKKLFCNKYINKKSYLNKDLMFKYINLMKFSFNNDNKTIKNLNINDLNKNKKLNKTKKNYNNNNNPEKYKQININYYISNNINTSELKNNKLIKSDYNYINNNNYAINKKNFNIKKSYEEDKDNFYSLQFSLTYKSKILDDNSSFYDNIYFTKNDNSENEKSIQIKK